MNAVVRRRLADIIPRLASDAPGEVVASAAAVGRILTANGHDWHDLAALIASAAFDADPPYRDEPDWRLKVEACLRLQLWKTDWELQFLYGLQRWNGDQLTSKQERVLEKIYANGDIAS